MNAKYCFFSLRSCVVALCLLYAVNLSASQQTTPSLALTASSSFSMVLQPTKAELGFNALQAVEEAIASTLLILQDENLYLDTEAVIQQSDFLAMSATRLRFFVIVTTTSIVDPASVETDALRAELNTFIQQVFQDSMFGRNSFLREIRASPSVLLANVTDLVVTPIIPSDTPPGGSIASSDSSTKKLSSLDIALIVVSGLIFFGILYMILQHHKDRGYIENQRHRAFNHPMAEALGSRRKDSKSYKPNDDDAAPSTPSTMTSSADNDGMEFNTLPETPDRLRMQISAHTPPPTLRPGQKYVVLNETVPQPTWRDNSDSASQDLAETFDKSSWFVTRSNIDNIQEEEHNYEDKSEKETTQMVPGLVADNYGEPTSIEDANPSDLVHTDDRRSISGNDTSPSEDTSINDDADDEDDPFQVGRPISSPHTTDTASKSSASVASTASAVSEWMRSIRVVSSDARSPTTSVTSIPEDKIAESCTSILNENPVTSGTPVASPVGFEKTSIASDESIAQTSLGASSFSQNSLEQSLESSGVTHGSDSTNTHGFKVIARHGDRTKEIV